MKNFPANSHSQRQGVALIAVLGLLSVMILLGITFAISMRTSRMATQNYSHIVQARQLIHAAIAGTLTNLNDKISGDVYPAWDVEKSEGGLAITGSVFLSSTDLPYIPKSLQLMAQSEAGAARWHNITDLSTSNVVGRFAYLAVNNSGLLDINTANRDSRRYGTNTFEIQIDEMSEISNAGQFLTDRTSKWGRFETLAELQELNIQGLQSNIDNLFIFSRMPPGYLESGAIETSIVIRTLADIQANKAAIESRLSGITGADQNRIFNSLHDYMDPDSIPEDPLGFATETHPLINELSISNRTTTVGIGPPATVQNQWQIDIELFYPFHQAINIPLTDIEVQATITANGGGGSKFNGTATTPAGGNWNTNSPIRRLTPITITGSDSNASVPTDLDIDIILRIASSGDILDQIERFNIPYAGFAPLPPTVIGASQTGATVHRETDDPRINWNWNQHWFNTGPTWNAMNSSASYLAAGSDGGWIVHVANSNLYSVGELGHLLYDDTKPWQTIRFLNPDPAGTAKVLDWFTVETNGIGRGKVNINSTEAEVLQAPFVGLDVRRWFGDTSPISSVSVDTLAIATGLQTPNPSTFTNLSDISVNLTENEVDAALGGGVDPAYAEGVIRDSVGLLGTRQNIFTIFFLVQSGFLQDTSDPASFVDLSEQKALVVIWRDPYPDAQGRYPVLTRFFKWMAD